LLGKGFFISQQDLQPQHSYVATPEEKVFPLDEHTTQIGLYSLMQRLQAM